MKRHLKNEEGSALIMTLIVLSMLVILGYALVDMNVSGRIQSATQDEKVNAYYIAKSGAEATSEYILNHTETFLKRFKTVIQETPDGGTIFTLDEDFAFGRFQVNLIKGLDEFTIESTGYFGDTSTVLDLNIYDDNNLSSLNYIFNYVLFSKETLNLSKFTDVKNNASASNSDIIEKVGYVYVGTNKPNSLTAYQAPSIPTYSTNSTVLTTTTNYSDPNNKIKLSNTPTYYKEIIVPLNTALTIDTDGKDRILIVDKMDLKGDLILSNTNGRVLLFVKDEANFSSPFVFVQYPLLIFASNPSVKLNFDASGEFNAFVYAPESTVNLSNSLLKFKGAIIANTIEGNGYLSKPIGSVEYKALTGLSSVSAYIKITNQPHYVKGNYSTKDH